MLNRYDPSQPPVSLVANIHHLLPEFQNFIQQAAKADHLTLVIAFQELVEKSQRIKQQADDFTAYIDHA